MKPELDERNTTISYAGIPTTEAEKSLVKLPPIGFIPIWKDNELMH